MKSLDSDSETVGPGGGQPAGFGLLAERRALAVHRPEALAILLRMTGGADLILAAAGPVGGELGVHPRQEFRE
ncbi:MAG TPA: hypothetical protein VKR62_08155, partial [Roseiarcus sp.]|nr:hypothetical protein [Roseiarcus sp.]